MKNYFTIPIKANKLITQEEHGTCDLKQSIVYHIHLINTSYFGECSFDESYGCTIWDIDFDNLSSSNKVKEMIRESLIESLKKHEKRLSKIAIEVNIKQEEIPSLKNGITVKKKVTLEIKGKIKKTNEDFHYNEYFYIGPLSY